MVSSSSINTVVKALPRVRDQFLIFFGQARKELLIAQEILERAGSNESLIREALGHMESAFSRIHRKRFADPTATVCAFGNSGRRTANNQLCYLIALLHYELSDGYSIVKLWSTKLAIFTDVPAEFYKLLKDEDKEAIYLKDKEAQEEREWKCETINDTWPDF
ncbi:MAG: hypothetical protein LKF31_02955 [Muribaculaceae bacterium]|jgi:hypothetical protein|nr:hypothetical protein [Muribaculaceae bacterium]